MAQCKKCWRKTEPGLSIRLNSDKICQYCQKNSQKNSQKNLNKISERKIHKKYGNTVIFFN